MTLAVGIDAGGTKLAAGLVDAARGVVIARAESPTMPARGGGLILEDVHALARSVLGEHEAGAIGLAVPELVTADGQITSAVTWDWRGADLAGRFADLGPLRIESDVRAAALGEAHFGAGVGRDSFVYVSVGTGVSFCLVVGGEPWAGARGNALIVGAPPVEYVASGSALATRAGKARAEQVLADPADSAIVDSAIDALAGALAALVNALDPQTLILGGGLGLEATFMDPVVAMMRTRVYCESTRQLEVTSAALGADSGIVGAALGASLSAGALRPRDGR